MKTQVSPGTKTESHLDMHTLHASTENLKAHVHYLTSLKPARNAASPQSLKKAADYAMKYLQDLGLKPELQPFRASGETYYNISVLYGNSNEPRVVIGAHYDVAGNQPGADDNASGVAGVLELARLLMRVHQKIPHPIELVLYSLEEPPHFGGTTMGSYIHAHELKKSKVPVLFMASLEMIGYFKDEKNSQTYPLPFMEKIYPNQGNFIAAAGRLEEKKLLAKLKQQFKLASKLPIETLSAPRGILGVDLSDHINYWEHGMKAIIVTDTAFMRNPHYHRESDQASTLDYTRMAEVINGLLAFISQEKHE